MGHLSKRGDPYLRTLLIHGARAVIARAKHKPKWLEQLLARRPMNVAVAALTKNMADELGPLGIHVTVVHPGLTRTERTGHQLCAEADTEGGALLFQPPLQQLSLELLQLPKLQLQKLPQSNLV